MTEKQKEQKVVAGLPIYVGREDEFAKMLEDYEQNEVSPQVESVEDLNKMISWIDEYYTNILDEYYNKLSNISSFKQILIDQKTAILVDQQKEIVKLAQLRVKTVLEENESLKRKYEEIKDKGKCLFSKKKQITELTTLLNNFIDSSFDVSDDSNEKELKQTKTTKETKEKQSKSKSDKSQTKKTSLVLNVEENENDKQRFLRERDNIPKTDKYQSLIKHKDFFNSLDSNDDENSKSQKPNNP